MRKTIMGFDQEYVSTLVITKTIKEKEVTQRVDYTDLAILRWFVDFQASGMMTAIDVNGERYFWISFKKLLEDMPLLDVNKKAVSDRLQKLVSFKLLKYYYAAELGCQTFFCMGENYINLIQKDNNERVGGQPTRGLAVNQQGGSRLIDNNNNIKDNLIKDNNIPPINPPKGEKEESDNSLFSEDTVESTVSTFDELKSRINTLYKRRSNTPWSKKDINTLKEIAKREDVLSEMSEIERLYNSGYEYRRTAVSTFLNNFAVELDRARMRFSNSNSSNMNNKQYINHRATNVGEEDYGKDVTNGF